MCVCIYIYIYIYERKGEQAVPKEIPQNTCIKIAQISIMNKL